MSGRSHFLVTGTAGFIGFHLARRLLADGHAVTGIDGMTAYYDRRLKEKRLQELCGLDHFRPIEAMIEKPDTWRDACDASIDAFGPIDTLVHLAAQAGVRYSIDAPETYVASNLVGTFAILELARIVRPRHMMLASTSSVYGMSDNPAFSEHDDTRRPVSFYAATKVGMEAMAHAYAHIHAIPVTAFRFFTVYGPWGRPDMAPFKFTRAILAGDPIEVYGEGDQQRDFTYVDDLIEAIVRLSIVAPQAGTARSTIDTISPVAPYRVVNIGGGRPIPLMEFIETLEETIGLKAKRIMRPMQQGDVRRTAASPQLLNDLTGFVPRTELKDGLQAFVSWYRAHYN